MTTTKRGSWLALTLVFTFIITLLQFRYVVEYCNRRAGEDPCEFRDPKARRGTEALPKRNQRGHAWGIRPKRHPFWALCPNVGLMPHCPTPRDPVPI